ncbi:MAG: type II toxin-antitoxin system RelE/ParE family toxin [Ardenticatenales bacterium]|nr:type II toxin-antitoxin system RelE/ParE family toxin [Ardenticatenales bacterium]
MYDLVFSKQATKALRKAPAVLSQRIRKQLAQIAADPYGFHSSVTKLQGRPGYRARIGDWRVIYEIQDDRLVILVLRIAPRGEVYQ